LNLNEIYLIQLPEDIHKPKNMMIIRDIDVEVEKSHSMKKHEGYAIKPKKDAREETPEGNSNIQKVIK
jgi:hypothetical protein